LFPVWTQAELLALIWELPILVLLFDNKIAHQTWVCASSEGKGELVVDFLLLISL
jgi:hypothetical protein